MKYVKVETVIQLSRAETCHATAVFFVSTAFGGDFLKTISKVIASLLVLIFLCSCAPTQPEPPIEPVVPENPSNPIEEEPLSAANYLGKDFIPTEELSELDLAALDAFRNEPKEAWGEQDFSLYTCDGQVLLTAGPSVDKNASMTIHDNRSTNVNCVTYRGVRLGDDAVQTFERVVIPQGAVYVTASKDGEHGVPFEQASFAAIIQEEKSSGGVLYLEVFFNENFEVVDVRDVFPVTENVGAQWRVVFYIQDGVITAFHAIYMMYDTGEK